MDSDALRDDQWERLKGLVPGGTKGKRGPRANNRGCALSACSASFSGYEPTVLRNCRSCRS